MDVSAWLRSLGLERYEQAFRDHDIDAGLLPRLTLQDLLAIGVTSVGHRRRLLEAIATVGTVEPALSFVGVGPPPVRKIGAERRQLTVMFIDLVGSTRLHHRLDPEEMGRVVRSYENTVAGEVARFEGHIVNIWGDGILAYFGWPRAHENEAERAARAGLAVVRALAKMSSPIGEPLAARVGIATGLVVVGELFDPAKAREDAAIGPTLALATRLQMLAEPGSVLMAPSTRRLVGQLFELVDLGEQTIKGFDDPVHAWRLLRESPEESRFEAMRGLPLTPLVGRGDEIEMLRKQFDRARKGDGQVLLLQGEPGIGKSRIVYALRESISSQRHTVLNYFCSPFHINSALYPVIKHLERAAGFTATDSPAMKLDRIEALLPSPAGDAAPLLAALLSVTGTDRYPPSHLTPDEQKRQTLDILVQQIADLALRQPLLVIFEDVHWIDPSTLDFLDMIVDRAQRLPILAVATFRPEFTPAWVDCDHVTSLALGRLARPDSAVIVEALTRGRALPPKILEQILTRTEGVPLFIEELTKTLLESGLFRAANDQYVLTGSLQSLAIPTTLQDSLLARLDRLGPAKELAQIGAALGREFSYDLLAAVSQRSENELQAALSQVVAAELLVCIRKTPHAIYYFKHVLMQEAAYSTLLKSRRRQLHARIARELEASFPDRTKAEPELLAHHHTEAAQTAPAVDYWLKAGQRAVERSANLEAISHLSQGLDLIGGLPPGADRDRREIAIQTSLGNAWMSIKGHGAAEVAAAFARVRTLCACAPDESALFNSTWNLWMHNQSAGRIWAARDLSDELLHQVDQEPDSDRVLQANHAAWTTKFLIGELVDASRHVEQGLRLYSLPAHRSHAFLYGSHDPGVCCRTIGGVVRWLLGYPAQADALLRESLAVAEARGHPLSTTLALGFGAMHSQFRREPMRARELAERAAAIANEHGFGQIVWVEIARIVACWAAVMLDPSEAAVSQMRAELDRLESLGTHRLRAYYLSLFAECCGQIHAHVQGLNAATRATMFAERTSDRWWEAEMCRVMGDLCLSPSVNAIEEAEAHYRRAIALAENRGAKSLELRAATGLARLWHVQGRARESRELLMPIHGWFTEGFETLDVKEASALLQMLE